MKARNISKVLCILAVSTVFGSVISAKAEGGTYTGNGHAPHLKAVIKLPTSGGHGVGNG